MVTAGSRFAGALLVVNALLSLALAATAHTHGVASPIPSGIVDLIVAYGLVTGRAEWRKWALVRVVGGAVIFGAIFAAQGDWLSVIFQLALSASLILLLLGDPGRLRIGAGVAVAGPYLALTVLVLVSQATGPDGVVRSILAPWHTGAHVSGTVQGTRTSYCIDVPREGWYLRAEAAARRDNPLSDRWLMQPDLDVHLVITTEQTPGVFRQDAYEKAAMAEAREDVSDFRLVRTDFIPGGTLFDYTGRSMGRDLEYYRGAFADGGRAFQMIAFGSPESMAAARAELESMFRSFRTNC